jgi:hypothetical protein
MTQNTRTWTNTWTGRRISALDREHLARTDLYCGLCRGPQSAHEDPWHLANECASPGVTAARVAVHQSLPERVTELVHVLLMAHHEGPHAPRSTPWAVSAAADASLALLPTQLSWWSTAEGQFITFRLLGGLPWSAAAAAPSHWLVRALGQLMDAVILPRSLLRRTAVLWTTWSLRALDTLATARLHAYSDEALRRTAGRS